jgi:nitroreductase
MDTYKTILRRRSIRSFRQRKIDIKFIKRMINAARLAPSAANIQPLEFFAITTKPLCMEMFKHLKWAGYIAPNANPGPDKRPVAYIIILINMKKVSRSVVKRDECDIRFSFTPELRDIGAAAENIMLFAESKGIASCWLGSINKHAIKKMLSIPHDMEVDSVIALGYPDASSRIVKYKGSVRYYLDQKRNMCVPKRPLKQVMHINRLTT